MWAALMRADELLLVHEVEAPHRWIVMPQLVSVLVPHLVPDGRYLSWTAIAMGQDCHQRMVRTTCFASLLHLRVIASYIASNSNKVLHWSTT